MKVTKPNTVAWVRNQEFPAPKTGRLSLIAWVRTKDESKQPQLRMAIDTAVGTGRGYYKYATLGEYANGEPTGEKLGETWPARPYMFHFDTLPADLDKIVIGFDLVGEGEVWIDDVEVYDLYFFETELNELLKNAATAHFQLGQGRVADCEQFLDSYWPRFVIEHVPPSRVAKLPRSNRSSRVPQPTPDASTPEEKPSGLRRYVPWLPFSTR